MGGARAIEAGIIAEAYEELAPAPGEFVSIRALREGVSVAHLLRLRGLGDSSPPEALALSSAAGNVRRMA